MKHLVRVLCTWTLVIDADNAREATEKASDVLGDYLRTEDTESVVGCGLDEVRYIGEDPPDPPHDKIKVAVTARSK